MMKRTPEGQALTALILEVFRLNGAMLDAGNQITEPHGLTSARWQVMGALDLAGHGMTVSQIARRMGLARQGVQRIVNDLVKLEMVVVDANLDHKRAPLISIGEKGNKALAAVNQAQVAWVNQLSDGLGERQLLEALKTLLAVRERSEEC
ncbi:MAG: MarR family winged helix-turn-helix transcriptional regulator [Geminicoccaceae bacterium]